MRVKIDGVETKLGTNGGKPYYVVNTMGSKVTSFDAKFLQCVGKEIEVEFGTNDKGYKTIKFISETPTTEAPQAQQTPPPTGAGSQATAPVLQRAESKENANMKYRAKAIEYALKSAELSKATVDESKSNVVLTVAEKYFKYISNDTHSE